MRRTEQRPSNGTASPPRRGMHSLKPVWRDWARSCDAARSAAECISPRASCGGSTLACTNKMHTGTKAARVAPWRLVLCETRDAVGWAQRTQSGTRRMTAGRYLCFERLACPRPCNPLICRTRFAVAQAKHEGCFSRHISPVPPVSPPALTVVSHCCGEGRGTIRK